METQKINTKKQILRKQIREKNAHLDPEYCLWADKRIREWIFKLEIIFKRQKRYSALWELPGRFIPNR